MEGWWCVRHRDALAWVEAPTAAAAVRRSLGLHPLGDWTDDAGALVVFPQDDYPDNAGPHDCIWAVLSADPPSRRRRSGPRKPRPAHALACLAAAVVLGLGLAHDAAAKTWRGLALAPDSRCSPYDKKRDYPYPQSVERDIAREFGAVYGPYTGTCFASTRQTDIEHIVAASEGHDSGLCAAHAVTKARFARHLRTLTLAKASEAASRTVPGMTPFQSRCGHRARSESRALTGSRPTGDILTISVVPAVSTRESR